MKKYILKLSFLGSILLFVTTIALSGNNAASAVSLFSDDFEQEDDANFIYWTTENLEGWHYWHVIAWNGAGGAHCMRFENTDVDQNDWLITKAINTENADNILLNFDNFYIGQGVKPKLFYSTNYNGNAGESSWTEISYSLGESEDQWSNSGDIVFENPGSTIWFAFRYQASANEGIYFLLDNFNVKSYTPPPPFTKVGSSSHFDYYTNLEGESSFYSGIQTDLENEYKKLSGIWNRPGINEVFPSGTKIKIYYSSKEDIVQADASTPKWKCGFHNNALKEIYLAPLENQQQTGFYGNFAKLAVNEFAQLAISCKYLRENNSYFPPYFLEGFGLYESGFRPNRNDVIDYVNTGTAYNYVTDTADISTSSLKKSLTIANIEGQVLTPWSYLGLNPGASSFVQSQWPMFLQHFYTDPESDRIKYQHSSEHFDFYHADSDQDHMTEAYSYFENACAFYIENYNFDPGHRFNVVFAPTEAAGMDLTGYSRFNGGAGCGGDLVMEISPNYNFNADGFYSDYFGYDGLCAHEFFHIYYNHFMWEIPGGFWAEGTADFSQRHSLNWAIPEHSLWKINALFSDYQQKYNVEVNLEHIYTNPNGELDIYFLGDMFFEFLYQNYGGYANIMKFFNQGMDYSVFNASYAEIDDGYINFLKSLIGTQTNLPEVETFDVTDTSPESAILNGNVVSDGGASITQRGFYWSSENDSPGVSDNVLIADGTTGSFSSLLSRIAPGGTYYYRAFATNANGTSTGEVKQFFTLADDDILELPFFDDFTNDYMNWNTYSVSGDDAWHLSGDDGVNGSKCARFYITTDPPQENIDWLLTKKLNTAGLSTIKIEFKYVYLGDGPIPEFYYTSAFTGDISSTSWTEIDNSFWGELYEWHDAAIEIENPGIELVFAIKYQSTASASDYVLIDNFVAKGFDENIPTVTIHDIQGDGEISPLTGQQIHTQGRIMAANEFGFFMQDTTGVRSGIYVYAPELAGKYVQGDNVELVASVEEYNGKTELLNVTQINYTNKIFPTYLPVIDASEIGEDYEGVFVSVEGLKVVYKNQYDEYVTVSAGGDSVIVDNFIIQPDMEIGKTYKVNGIIDYTYESYRINPRYQAGITEMDDSKVAITFSVDMKFETVHPDGVFINGSFSNWEQPLPMVADGTVWSVTLQLTPGENVIFKFLNGNPTGWDTYENPQGDCSTGDTNDRFLVVPDAATALEMVCFNQCSACADIETFPWLSISEIQGDGDISPYVGQQVRTKGRIMAINQYGFFIQDTTGVRSGIFVYAPDWAEKFVQGDHVELAATIDEYNGKTELLDVLQMNYTEQLFPTYMTTITGADVGEDYEGVIVTIKGLTVAYKNAYNEYVSVTAEGDSVIVDNYLIQPEMEIGKTYNVIGIVDYLNGRFSLNPRAQQGIQLIVPDISIGIAGTFNDWGNAGPDIQMVQNSTYENYWTIEYEFTEDTELKFRNDNSWNVNWGNDVFPFGTGVQDGPNVPVPAGSYHVFFDSNTGEYKFEIMSRMLKIREIQGNGESSPYLGQQVKTQGRIMAVNPQGFFIQDTTGIRSGIFVYAPELEGQYAQSDHVELAGTVEEYHGKTEITNIVYVNYTHATFPTYMTYIKGSEIGEDYEGVITAIENLKVVYQNTAMEYVTVTPEGDSVIVDNFIIQPEMEIGKTYNVAGIIDYLNDRFSLNPRAQSGIQLVEPETVAIKFQVNMLNETVSDSGVYINGSWCDWEEPVKLTKEGYDYFTVVLNLPKYNTFQYKFVNGGSLEWDKYEDFEGSCLDSETGNRSVSTPGVDVTLSPVCYNQCSECDNNQTPYAYGDIYYIEEDSSLTFWLDARDNEDIYSNLKFEILDYPAYAIEFSENKGMIYYKPLPNFSGTDFLTFTVSDSKGSMSAIAKVEFVIEPVNDKPEAKSFEANAWNQNELTIDLAPYISDLETSDNELKVEFVPQDSGVGEGITGGKISKLDGTRYKYINENPLLENDYVVFRVSDGQLRSYAQVITISNLPVNKSIRKVESNGIYTLNDEVDVTYGKRTELEFLGIDVEIPLEKLNINIIKQPVNGTLVGSINESYSGSVLTSFYSWYKATENMNVTDSVVFEISDGVNSARGVQYINIQAVKVAPVISQISPQFSNVNQQLNINLNVKDDDSDIGNLTWTITSEPESGFIFSLANENTAPVLEITPPTDFTGNSTIKVKVTDSDSQTDEIKFALTISGTNSLPEYTNALSLNAVEDEPYSFLFEATDLDNDSLVFTFSNLPEWITVDNFARNSVQLSGIPSFIDVGRTSVFATISDGKSQISKTLSLEVLNVNNAPEIIQVFDTLYATVGDEFGNIYLTNYFSDKDPEDVLSFKIIDNSDESLLQTTVNGELLTVFFAPDEKGIVKLTIQAESNGAVIQSELVVNINTKITAVNEWTLQNLNVYPNPASEKLCISGLPAGNVVLKIITPDGRTVLERTGIDAPLYEIEVGGLPAGVYLLLIRNSYEMNTHSFIKR